MALIECKECKQKISNTATVCPSCGKRVSPKLSGILSAGIVVLGLLIFVSLVSGNNNNESSNTGSSATSQASVRENAMEVSLDQILKDYKNNEVNADKQYKDKRIKVTGIVGAIKKDITNNLYVTIGHGEEFEIPEIQAFFDEAKSNQLAQLNKGEKVTVTCRVSGLMMNVLAKNCELN